MNNQAGQANQVNQGMMQPQAVTTVETKKGMSKWWPISFFIAAIIFIIIGGGLVGAWAAGSSSYYYSYYYDLDDRNSAQLYAGAAMIAIGGILKLVAWILLIIRCVQSNRFKSSTVIYQQQPVAYNAGTQQQAPAYVANGQQYPPPSVQYCGSCGALISASGCPKCGPVTV